MKVTPPMRNSTSYESLTSLQTTDTVDTTDSSRKYQKISMQTRNELLNQIFFRGKKIKKAAKDLNINYSSAKTILHLYRKKFKSSNCMPTTAEDKECEYRRLSIGESSSVVQVVCTFGGQFGHQSTPDQDQSSVVARFLQNLACIRPQVNQKRTVQPIIVTPIDKAIFN